MRRHSVLLLEGPEQGERARAELGGQGLQGGRLGHPALQDGPGACRVACARRPGRTRRQRAAVPGEQARDQGPQHAVRGEGVALLRRAVDLADQPGRVRIDHAGLREADRAAQVRRVGRDVADHLGGRVERGVHPPFGHSGACGVRDLGVDHDDSSGSGVDGPAGQSDVLDALGDGPEDVALVAVAGECVADVAGPQQIEVGQLRVLPVPRPLLRALRSCHARILAAPGGRGRRCDARPGVCHGRCQWRGARWGT